MATLIGCVRSSGEDEFEVLRCVLTVYCAIISNGRETQECGDLCAVVT